MEYLLIEMGLRISTLRRQQGLTQEELAESAGLSGQTISAAELGKKALRPENIIKISKSLGVSTDYLLTGCRGGIDHEAMSTRLKQISPEKYDQIMRVVAIMLEE